VVDDFFKIVAAGPAFFVSAWLLMLFAGIVGTEVGIRPFGYLTYDVNVPFMQLERHDWDIHAV
jgi:hypothetical protein